MGIYKKGNTYWMIKQYRGRKIERSLDTKIRRVAEERYAKIVAEIIDGCYFEKLKAESVTFSELWEQYKVKYERQRDSTSIKHLLPVFGQMTLADITTDAIEDFILERAEAGAAGATVYQEFALGRRMFNVARKKWKYTKDNPFADVTFGELVTIDNKRDRVISIDEEMSLLTNATPSYLQDIIIFALHSGCRRKEILSVTWKNVDMRERVLHVVISKRKPGEETKHKIIPMSETLFQMLLQRAKLKHVSGKIFPYKATAVKDAFERAVEKAKLQDFRFHDLRHTFATRLIQSGTDLFAISKMLGHSTLRMTERYSHHSPASLRPSVKALDYYNFTTAAEAGKSEAVAGL